MWWNELECGGMCQNVVECARMWWNVPECGGMCQNVVECGRMNWNVELHKICILCEW